MSTSAGKLRSQSVLNDLTFESSNTPAKVIKSLKYINANCGKISERVLTSALKMAFAHALGEDTDSERMELVFQRMLEKCDVTHVELMTIYSHLITISSFAVHQRSLAVKKEILLKKMKEAGTSAELCEKIISLTYSEERNPDMIATQNSLPKLDNMRWRVNVAISTSSLNRVLEPTVVIEMKTSDGKITTFEISMSKFHELRFGVSSLMKEMEAVSKR